MNANVKTEWSPNTAGTEWTMWINDRARAQVYTANGNWTGIYVASFEEGRTRVYRLADGFEAAQHAIHALSEAIEEGGSSSLWSKPDKLSQRRGRPAHSIGANVAQEDA